jgi:hypothetical protein
MLINSAGITSYANGYGLVGMVSSIVASDWMSTLAMDYIYVSFIIMEK